MARQHLKPIWQAADTSMVYIDAADLLQGDAGRQAAAVEARIAHQFVHANQSTFAQFDIHSHIDPTRDGHVRVGLRTASRVGAMPLRSPTTGLFDHGLIIRPRFGWHGLGPILADTKARVQPALLRLPQLPRSESSVPPWVISAVVLTRLERLMGASQRQFNQVSRIEDRPRGHVDWAEYLCRHVAVARPYELPCVYSTLTEDPLLIGAVHAATLKQLAALTPLRTDVLTVRRLMGRYESLKRRVQWANARWDRVSNIDPSSTSSVLADALEAMQWTRDDRGLAGIHPLGGLAWVLPMEEMFEVWVETVARTIAQTSGGTVRTGRLRETLRPLSWNPPYTGSQRYLLPDVELVREDETIIFDAKYKSHWEEIDERRWFQADDHVRESHRSDLLQVLAYAGATDAQRVTCVLMYPCREDTWASLVTRDRFAHRAEVPAGRRTVRLILMAIPLGTQNDVLAAKVARELFH